MPLTVVETGGGREAVGEEEDHGQGSGGCWSLKELKDEGERERENAGSVQRKNKILKKI